MRPTYRMYVDENGNNDLGASNDPNHRYLGLTGIICSMDEVASHIAPELDALKKKYFGSHPDDPIVLHRNDMTNKRRPFHPLRDPVVCAAFDDDLHGLLGKWNYKVVTTVIDKLEHMDRYKVWLADPYHYCLEVLLERYAMLLNTRDACGDVLAESRGAREDIRLKGSFSGLYDKGTSYVDAVQLQKCITSRELKLKTKKNNIAGLQIADVVAHPSYKAMIAAHGGGTPPGAFGARVVALLEASKYRRRWDGRIDGWGTKWLP